MEDVPMGVDCFSEALVDADVVGSICVLMSMDLCTREAFHMTRLHR